MEIMASPTACDSPGKQLESNDVVIDVPLVMGPALWPRCCIYRVPKKLRKVNEEAYTPKFVSIGPFHHGRKELRDMEMYKLRYFKDFLYRTKKCQEDFRNIIEDYEVEIRHCYSESSRLDSKDFVKMILLDAIFIIELFLKEEEEEKAKRKEEEEKAKREKKEEEKDCKRNSDYILSQPWLQNGILHDLILLENQIPFFVLEKLYMFTFGHSSSCNNRQEGQRVKEHKEESPFVQLSRKYFECYYDAPKSIINKEVKHLTDLLRYLLFIVPDDLILQRKEYMGNVYSATRLDYAGLKFKPVHQRSLLELTFSFKLPWVLACLPCLNLPFLVRVQSILTIPQLVIGDNTEVVFRNLMALEQCHYPSNTYICNYVLLMNYLLNTEQDVELLVDKRVIVNYIGSNAAVAFLFSKLCFQILETKSCYGVLTREINRYCENPWNRMMASIKGTYFRDFGRAIATVGVLLALLGLFVDLRSF